MLYFSRKRVALYDVQHNSLCLQYEVPKNKHIIIIIII